LKHATARPFTRRSLVDPEPAVLDRFAHRLQHKPHLPPADGVELVWRIPPALPVIETDPGRLTMVLDNLINNAIKFTAAGRIIVSIHGEPESEQVRFRVEDTGKGIAESDLRTIFEAFRQVDTSFTRSHDGVGLGLTIVEKYVDLLGGRVEVRSQLGAGSCFVVTLPYRVSTSASRLPATRTASTDRPAASAAA
jgi:signal transduction histidine kinase